MTIEIIILLFITLSPVWFNLVRAERPGMPGKLAARGIVYAQYRREVQIQANPVSRYK